MDEVTRYLTTRCRRYPWFMPKAARDRARTVFPFIFMPDLFFDDSVPRDWGPLLRHEAVHLVQQSDGARWVPIIIRLAFWLVEYALSKKDRLRDEAQAIAIEICAERDASRQEQIYYDYCRDLQTFRYGSCAKDKAQASEAIILAIMGIGGQWRPPQKEKT